MPNSRFWFVTVLVACVAYIAYSQRKVSVNMVAETTVWNFTAQRGYFSHDNDPETWEFRATTRKSLGLLERSYSTNDSAEATNDSSQWTRFEQHISQLNQEAPDTKRYKLLYIVRHGQGLHNVKEREVGREEWNVSH
jgi:hypothetical protein